MSAPEAVPFALAGMLPESAEGRLDEDARLFAALRARSPESLERLVRRFSGTLARAAWLQLQDAQGADDVVQETLIAAWDGAASARSDTRLRPWLFAILCNRCRSFCRGRRRRTAHEASAQERWLAERAAAAPDVAHDDEALGHALAALSEPLRLTIILRYLEGLDVADTAAALAVPAGTIKRRTHDALALLRQRLGSRP